MLFLIHSFKSDNLELNLYRLKKDPNLTFSDLLCELTINGQTNALDLNGRFDGAKGCSNLAVDRFHKLTKGVYKDELRKIVKKLK